MVLNFVRGSFYKLGKKIIKYISWQLGMHVEEE